MREYLQNAIKALHLFGRIDVDSCVFYLEEMRKWNKTHGLTAITEPHEMVIKHIADSLSIHHLILGERLADVGTGAGLPGIPLALLFKEKHVTLIESQHKKAAFLRHIKRALGLNHVEVIQSKVEIYQPKERFDGIITRAFSSLPHMLQLTRHLCASEGYFLAMKGEIPQAELNALKKDYPDYRIESLFVPELNAQRHAIILFN